MPEPLYSQSSAPSLRSPSQSSRSHVDLNSSSNPNEFPKLSKSGTNHEVRSRRVYNQEIDS